MLAQDLHMLHGTLLSTKQVVYWYVLKTVNDARGIYDLTIINLGWYCQDVLCQLVQPKPYLYIQFGYIPWYSYKNIRIIHSLLNTNVSSWIEKF